MFNQVLVTQITVTPLDAYTPIASRWPMPVTTAAHFLYSSMVLEEAAVFVTRAFLGRISDTFSEVNTGRTRVTAQREDWK